MICFSFSIPLTGTMILFNADPHLLKKTKEDYSENDFLRLIWSSILELLFLPYEHGLIVKTGETITIISQEHKEEFYVDSLDAVVFSRTTEKMLIVNLVNWLKMTLTVRWLRTKGN